MTAFVMPESVSASTAPVVQDPIYKVTFNANRGKVNIKTKLVQYSNIYGSLPVPTRKKYTFRGWYTNTKGGSKVTQYSVYKVKGNQTIYARWQKTTSYEKSVVKYINEYRKKKKYKKFKWDKKIYKGTKKRSKEITKKFSHVRPNGGSGARYILKFVKKGRSSGECLGKGFDEPKLLVDAFMGSPTHERIIMMKKGRTCAVSCKIKTGVTYWALGSSAIYR
jgi:uncharacterized repeat protein (TIGR02543 family)